MTPEVYKLIHVAASLCLFLGLGGILAAGGKDGGRAPAIYMVLHGIGLVAGLVAGIGFVHKTGLPWQNWLSAKVGIWVLLGALPFLVRRGILPRFVGLLLALVLAAVAVWAAQAKPF